MPQTISQTTYTPLITAVNYSWTNNSYSLSSAKLASTFGNYAASYIQNLSGFASQNVLMGTSLCADDVDALSASGNIGQYPTQLMKFLGPFSSSGLAGYPHYGITGVFAWASHVTGQGALFLLVTPHIGISQYGDVGQIYRRGQTFPSSTCGAVAASISTVVGNVTLPLSSSGSFPNDFQQWVLTNTVFPTRTTLLASTTAQQMLVATKTILDAASAAVTNVLVPSAYNAFFGLNSNVPVFACFGTFVNVDDGYSAYIAPIAFKRYDSTGWVDYSANFLSGLSSLT